MEFTSYLLIFLTIFIFVENFTEENCGSQEDWFFMFCPKHKIFIAYGSSIMGRVKPQPCLVTLGVYLCIKTKTGLKNVAEF